MGQSRRNERQSFAPVELVAQNTVADPSGKTGRIAAEIERRMMVGDYRFGETLSATQLAKQFDISRAPVSAALAHLRSSGFVEVLPQVGYRVVSPSAAEIGDFFVALGKLEAAAAALAARRYEDDEADRLVAIAERGDPNSLETTAQRQGYIANLHDYHFTLWTMARSTALADRVAGMRRLASFYLWQGMTGLVPPSAHLLIMERVEIAQAIKARDVTRAEILMEKHIAHKPHLNGFLMNNAT